MNAGQPLAPQRVLGWDLLRGLCALAVAAYHLLSWQDVVHWHSLGTHCVYLFFVLSGASLAYTYAGQIERHEFGYANFLLVRYLRLAPLYVLLVVLTFPWKLGKEGATLGLLEKLLSNLLFLFGFYQPTTHSLLVGGWSLGIEVIFYLAFPLLMAWVKFPGRFVLLWMVLLAVQSYWISATLGQAVVSDAAVVRYHHVPAFAAYFAGGCYIGYARRQWDGRGGWEPAFGMGLILAGVGLIGTLNSENAWDHLLGLRGAVLAALCFFLVAGAGRVRLSAPLSQLAERLGDSTYGVYLMHPVIFFGLSWVVIPKLRVGSMTEWSTTTHVCFAGGVIVASFFLALMSEYYLEHPVRVWSRRLLAASPRHKNVVRKA